MPFRDVRLSLVHGETNSGCPCGISFGTPLRHSLSSSRSAARVSGGAASHTVSPHRAQAASSFGAAVMVKGP
jgi:hypothetical protein